ncbi:OmpA family protein [uncultured Gilvimarinus sp.]|uniref:OmpA family protein n=1 Tax=uncultured Gilvimarinus sp. TaxID=1689143 RepID=UPI0030EF92D6|tara:strand:- start:712 stop:1617 length:906 start_codon:yes stop_codon:yes gene_type:complete
MIGSIKLSLLCAGLLASGLAFAEWGAESVMHDEWYRSNHPLVTGAIAYRDAPEGGYSEGYYASQTQSVNGYHVREIFDYGSEYTAGYLFKEMLEKLDNQGFSQIYTCYGLVCGDIAGWQLLTDRLLDGDAHSQSYVAAHNPLGGAGGTYLSLHIADLDTRPRAVIDVFFSDRDLTRTLDLASVQVVPVYDQSDVLEVAKIYFDRGSAHITERMSPVISELGETLNVQANEQLLIVGHADATGTYDFNMRLSRNRAEAVKQRLLEVGVKAQKIEVAGVGSVMNDSSANDKMNRRVEVIVRPL